MGNLHATREEWLVAAVRSLTSVFDQHHAIVPEKVRVTCGFPSTKALSRKARRIGECWSPAASGDGTTEIMISPLVEAPADILAILAHELVHAVVGTECGHKGPFRALAKGIGLEGKMTATVAGEAFKHSTAPALEGLGPYPHAKLDPGARPTKKQSTRLIKCLCVECGYVARTTQKWLDEKGAPHCPEHGEMSVE